MLIATMLGLDGNSVMHVVVHGLYVLAGFAIGFLVTHFLALGFDAWVSHRKSPDFVHKVAKLLGGVVVALLVALYYFGEGRGSGGKGNGGSGDSSEPQGTGNAVSTATTTPSALTKPTPPTQTNEPIRITVLGGYHEDEKYYLLDDEESRPATLNEAKAYVRRRKAEAFTQPALEIHLHPLNQTTPTNGVVKQLQDWGELQEHLNVSFPGRK